MTMPTSAEEAALAAFISAATSDDDPGYPHGAAFVPWQETPDAAELRSGDMPSNS
jgi:hypothetical protein